MKTQTRQRGTALIVVLVLFSLVAVSATVFMRSVQLARRVQRHSLRALQCDLAARSGIEHAIWELQKNPDFSTAVGKTGDAAYEVAVMAVADKPNEREVTSTGRWDVPENQPLEKSRRARIRMKPSPAVAEWLE